MLMGASVYMRISVRANDHQVDFGYAKLGSWILWARQHSV